MSTSSTDNPKSVFGATVIKHWRSISVLSVLIIAYALVGFLWVPKLIRSVATDYVSTRLHRHLSLGEIQFNPFTLTVRVSNAKFTEADGAPIASFAALLVNAELSSVWYRALNLKQVRITAPVINMIINPDGSLNLAVIKPADSPTRPVVSKLARVRIGSFELLQGQLQLQDRSRPQPFSAELKPITFTLKDFRSQADYENPFYFTAKSEAGETFDWRGAFDVQPLSASGRLKIGGLKAATIQGYLQDKLPFKLLSGAISLEGTYEFRLTDTLEFKLNLPEIQVVDARIAPRLPNASSTSQTPDIPSTPTLLVDAPSVSPVADTQAPWVILPQLKLSDTQLSLHDRSINIKQIDIGNASLQTWLDAQRHLNLLELLGPENHSDNHPEDHDGPKNDNARWVTRIDTINVTGTTVHTEDRGVTPATQFTLNPVQVKIQNFSTAAGTQLTLDTQFGIDGSSQLTAQGTVQLDTLGTQLKLRLSNFALPALQNYAAQSTDLIISGGQLTTEGELSYRGTGKSKYPQLQFTGAIDISNLSTQDKYAGQDFVKFGQLHLQGLRYTLGPDQLIVDEIGAQQPYVHLAINADLSTNVQRVLRTPITDHAHQTPAVADNVKANPAAPTMKIRVAKVVIDNGSAAFSDNSVKPAFATDIERLNGTITNLSTATDSRATFKLAGNVNDYAPMSLSGEANFLAAATYSDLALEFRNIELTTFNPYSDKYAGYNITKGKLATQMHYQVHDRKLVAQHHIVIDQLEFGDAIDSKDAVSLPLKLATALLKDRNGIIELNLPVDGSLDDPNFRVAPVVWQAFKNLLVKIVESPFAILGALFGGGEELAYVDFTPGSAVLSPVETDKLNKLASALLQRPQLKLDIPLTAITDIDAAALNQAALEQAIAPYLPKITNITAQQQLTALIALYKAKLNTAPTLSATADPKIDITAQQIKALRQQLLPLFAISANDRDALMHQRAEAVQAAILSNPELSPERIFLTADSNVVKSPVGMVRMELKLK